MHRRTESPLTTQGQGNPVNISESTTGRSAAVKVDGRSFNVHYHEVGSGDRCVIFLHGAGAGAGGWSNFSRNLEPFAERGWRVIAPDCLGFNKSDPIVAERSRASLNADTVRGLMHTLGIERVHLVGNSLGGASSIAFALQYPDALDRMVLMGPGGLGPSLFQPLPMEGIKLLMRLYQEPSLEALKHMLQVFVHEPSRLTPDLIEGRFANMMRHPEHLQNFITSFRNHPSSLIEDFTPRLGGVSHRTLVIWGRDDRFVPLDHGMKLVWALPNADLQVFGRCGHWAQWEHADKFNRTVLDFLQSS